MSRVRVGHKPEDWREEEPREARVTSHSGSALEIDTAAYRRMRAAEAAKRYREREATK